MKLAFGIKRANRLARAMLFLSAVSSLAACGGGGDAPAAAPPPPPPPAGNVLISGSEAALITAVLTEISDAPVPAREVSNGFLLSRLVVAFKADATVGQVNAAARAVGATDIRSSEPDSSLVVLQVAAQTNVAAIQSLAATLRAQPGVFFAWPGRTPKTSVLPEFGPGVPVANISLAHLLANRFPQAWNARQAIEPDCLPHSVNMYVMDVFGDPGTRPDFFQQVERSSFFADPTSLRDGTGGHGYDVVSTIMAKFDADTPTGANPFDDCVLVHARDAQNSEFVDVIRRTLRAAAADPEPRVILSSSLNFPDDGFCGLTLDQPCTAETVAVMSKDDMQAVLLLRAAAAIEWARLTRTLALHDKMLVAQSAGNVDPAPAGFLARNYLGFRSAAFSSPAALATHIGELRAMLTDSSLWKSATLPTLPDFTTIPSDADLVFADPALDPANDIDAANLVIVDSGASGETPADVRQSEFDMLGADVRAVGEDVVLSQNTVTGTSFSAPLAAGLASYLWNLSPALLAKPASATADLLKLASAHTPNSSTVAVLDAYAAVLRLDDVSGCCSGAATAPIRLGLLDTNGDGVFDVLDLQKFVEAYGLDDPNTPTIPAARDFSRFDLNGDGFTGGIPIAAFDLDLNGLDSSGQPLINSTDATIEGYDLSFNEAALSDLQILCYYAYSPLYFIDSDGQNEQARTDLLGPDHCVGARLDVQLPAQISSSGTLDTVVEVPDGQGSFAPAPNVLVDLAPTCATVSPTNGRTDADGKLAATVTPDNGCTSVSVRVIARADPGAPPLAQQVVTATVSGGSCAGAGGKVLSYFLADTTTTTPGIVFDETAAQLRDSLSDSVSAAAVTVDYGTVDARASGDALHSLDSSGAGTHDGGAQGSGEFQDSIIITPADPALLNTAGTATLSLRVTAQSNVSGQRAAALWQLSSVGTFPFVTNASRSTVPGQSSGDLSGGIYSVTGSFFFGQPAHFDVQLLTSVFYPCGLDVSCTTPASDAGSGSISALLQWEGMTVRDEAGNTVAFSVCSRSGKDWAAP